MSKEKTSDNHLNYGTDEEMVKKVLTLILLNIYNLYWIHNVMFEN